MQSAFCKFWISVVGIAVVTSVAGCGGNDTPGAPSASSVAAPSPSSPSVDVDAAFAQFLKAEELFWCSNAYSDIGAMADAGDVDTMKLRVHEYRGVMTTWDDKLGRIAVPPAAQPIVDKLHELNATEIADLDALVRVDENDKKEMDRLRGLVYFDDALVGVEADRLSAALGHPEPQGRIASDQLEVAYRTFYQDIAPVGDMFEAALSRNDLDGAKAANAIEEDAAQRYIDRLDAIDWPAQFQPLPTFRYGYVNLLRDNLRGLIEFDRRQVDVATTAQVVRAPDEGIPEVIALDAAKTSLQDGLAKLASESNPPFMC
jgi:hypothetical protein